MIKTTARADAFTEAAAICRTRARELSPGRSRSQAEFEIIQGKIEELETLAFLFDQIAVASRPESGVEIRNLMSYQHENPSEPHLILKNNGKVH